MLDGLKVIYYTFLFFHNSSTVTMTNICIREIISYLMTLKLVLIKPVVHYHRYGR